MFSTEGVQAARESRYTGHITCMQALAVQDGHLVITGSEDKTLRCGTNDCAVCIQVPGLWDFEHKQSHGRRFR